MDGTPEPAEALTEHEKRRARIALRLAEEIEENLACLTHEAFEMEAGEFCYQPKVKHQALYFLEESLKSLKMAINGVDY
tara:strand:- start:589 stop:825 length:237 start_codon:yes stop_codon:yes gene_type:complete